MTDGEQYLRPQQQDAAATDRSAAGTLRYAEPIDALNDTVAPTGPGALSGVRTPLGVVAAVAPWTFPLDMAAWKLAPALAAGNKVAPKQAQ